MKKLLIFLTVCMSFGVIESVEAHPGRTDANGGHTCRTNCERWGLQYGEYHYHNGGGTATAQTIQSVKQPTPQEIAQQERSKGSNAGYEDGKINGAKSLQSSVVPKQGSESNAYYEGFTEGYEKGFIEAQSILKENVEKAKLIALKKAETEDTLVVPNEYKENEVIEKTYTQTFNDAVEKRINKEKEQEDKRGYEDAMANRSENPNEKYVDEYNAGYQRGLTNKKEDITKLGYALAFTTLKYEGPYYKEELYETWHKEGFDKNNEIGVIQEAGYKLGLSGEKYVLQNEYNHAEVIFKEGYGKGYSEYEEKKKEQLAMMGIGGVTLATAGGGYYAYRRRKKNNK